MKTSIIFSLIFFLLVKLHPVWARIFPAGMNALLHLAGLAIVLVLAILGLISLFKVIFKGHYKKPASYIPVFILPLVLAEAWYNPLQIDLDRMFGAVIYKACFEGTQNQSVFRLRENGRFDIHWTGVFFYDEYYTGTYEMQKDTLILKYKRDKAPEARLGNKALLVEGAGITLFDKEGRPVRPNPYFLEVSCRD